MKSQRLITFLQTGVLGQLRLGMSLQAIIDYLGCPDFYKDIDAFWQDYPRERDYAVRVRKTDFIFIRYRSIELVYEVVAEELVSIKLEFFPNYKPYVRYPRALGLTYIHHLQGMTREDFHAVANEYDLTFYIHPVSHDGAKVLFVPSSLVWVIFELDPPPEKLYSITIQSWFGMPPYSEDTRWNRSS